MLSVHSRQISKISRILENFEVACCVLDSCLLVWDELTRPADQTGRYFTLDLASVMLSAIINNRLQICRRLVNETNQIASYQLIHSQTDLELFCQTSEHLIDPKITETCDIFLWFWIFANTDRKSSHDIEISQFLEWQLVEILIFDHSMFKNQPDSVVWRSIFWFDMTLQNRFVIWKPEILESAKSVSEVMKSWILAHRLGVSPSRKILSRNNPIAKLVTLAEYYHLFSFGVKV